MNVPEKITVAITGASGSIYGIELIRNILKADISVNLVISDPGFLVLKEEMEIAWKGNEDKITDNARIYFGAGKNLTYYGNSNYFSPLASGSSGSKTMVIAPCSMGSLARITGGISSNLVERAADVIMKESGSLVLLPRETPLNSIHLENMLKLSRMGVKIVPAMPAFYHKPINVAELVNFVVGRILDTIGIQHSLVKKWGEKD